MRYRILAIAMIATTALIALGDTAGAAIPGASAGHATPSWMVVSGLATVPIALLSLLALLLRRSNGGDDQDDRGGRLSAQGAACSNCDANRIRTSSRP